MTKLCNGEMRNLQLNFLCEGQGQKEWNDQFEHFEHVRKTTSPILAISPTLLASLCTCSPSNCTHHWWYSPPNLSQFPNIPSKTHGRPPQSPMPSAHQLSVRLSVHRRLASPFEGARHQGYQCGKHTTLNLQSQRPPPFSDLWPSANFGRKGVQFRP